MNVCRRAADVDNHHFTNTLMQKLRSLHDRARCWNDRAIDHVAHVFHARCVRDVIFERVLNDFAAGLDVHVIDLRVYILYVVEFLTGLFIENQFHLFLVLDVAGVDDRRLETEAADLLRIVDSCVSFAVVDAACDEDQIRLDLLDLLQIRTSEFAGCDEVDDAAGTQGCFLGGSRCHVVDQAVNCHLQTACRRRGRQHLVIFETVDTHLRAKVVDGALQADSDVAFQHRRRSLPLRPEFRIVAVDILECVYYCCR